MTRRLELPIHQYSKCSVLLDFQVARKLLSLSDLLANFGVRSASLSDWLDFPAVFDFLLVFHKL